MKQDTVQLILEQIRSGYDRISEKFFQTRKYFWRDLEWIRKYAKEGEKILDFGCGNGRLLELFRKENIQYTGIDISEKLIEQARKVYANESRTFLVVSPSLERVPFPDSFFNTVYTIAVFHHIPGKEKREEAARELFRITKNEGYIIVTVWNLWQPKYRKRIIHNWISKIIGRSSLDWNDCWIPFTDNKGNVFKRFHHAFTKKELGALFEKAGFSQEKLEEGRNIVFIGRKRA